jgi:hypothetical protein
VSTTASPDDGFDVVVSDDGSIPADELARHGVRPGAHLRLVVSTEAEAPPKRKSVRGSLAYLVKPGDMDAFKTAMAETRAERTALLLGDDE